MADIHQFPRAANSAEEQVDLFTFEHALVEMIDQAKAAGIQQGFIVALLHAHAYQQTKMMVD